MLQATLSGRSELTAVPENAFLFEVQEDGMEPELHYGDVVVVDPAVEVQSGQIALVYYKKRLLVRRVVIDNGTAIIQPLNPWFRPVWIRPEELKDITAGVVVKLIREYR